MFIAGDIGGTKTVLALFEQKSGQIHQVRQAVFPSRGHKSLEEIIGNFLVGERNLKLDGGCFGVAGAVLGGKCKTTNLPW
ncbi:MAG: glucokinase, partial [Planctomycetia bacterium]